MRSTCATSGRPARRSQEVVGQVVESTMFSEGYANVFDGDHNWQSLDIPTADMFAWDNTSTYVRQPPYFDGMPRDPEALRDITARGCSRCSATPSRPTTSPPRATSSATPPPASGSPSRASQPRDFNSYGSRRGNHEVMIRGTFANIRLRNLLVPGVEGGFTRHLPDGEQMSIFDASRKYIDDGVPLIVHRGKRVRLRLVPRLGGEGHAAARGEGGAGDLVRTHPPLQPDRDGRAAAAVPRGRHGRIARPDRRGDLLDHRASRARTGPPTRSP